MADRSESGPLQFEPFSDEQQRRIESTVTELVTVSNPFDYNTFMWGDRGAVAKCFTAVMDGPQDATMLVLDAPPSPANDASAWIVAVDALADAVEVTGGRAVVVATMAECLNEGLRAHIIDRGLTPLLGFSEGIAALEAAALVGARCDPVHAPVTQPSATRVVDEARGEDQARGARRRGPGRRSSQSRSGCRICREPRSAFPITLKALDLAHKSESGAVKVGLTRCGRGRRRRWPRCPAVRPATSSRPP